MKGLVLEGGGHRGIYTAGVLDVFLENKINFDGIIGVSAGSIHGASFKSRQRGRSLRYTMNFCNDKRYMSIRSYLKTGNFFNAKFCYKDLPDVYDPFDYDTFEKNKTPYYLVCTDLKTGKPKYSKCDSLRNDKMKWLQASASMPLVSKPVEINGSLFFDGGISDSIPIKAFEKMGFDKNIVVLTQKKGYSKKVNSLLPVFKIAYRKNPGFLKALANRHKLYNETLQYIEEQEKKGKILVIRPSEKPLAGRTEKNPDKIKYTYELGRRDATAMLLKMQSFLNLKAF